MPINKTNMYELKKTSFYYVIVNKNSGKMLLQDCKLPIYWSLKVANKRCELFSECKVIKILAKSFNVLIDYNNPPAKPE